MFAKPQKEHLWLEQLAGKWSVQHNCTMPDGSVNDTTGSMTCRSLQGLWMLFESTGKSPDGNTWSTMMTVGFDPAKDRYVGTYVGSMMAHLWLYEGEMDPSEKRLPLVCEGPAFDGSGTCKYRDTIEIVDADLWLFTSELQNEAGEWVKFMTGHNKRL